jgi:hypothetical protein
MEAGAMTYRTWDRPIEGATHGRFPETFFRTDAAAKEWQFYSRDPKFKRLLERRGYTVTEDHQGLWAANVPLKALTLRSKKAVTAKPTDEQRLKRSLLAKRPVADTTLSASDLTNGNSPVQPVEAENGIQDGGISC